MLRKIDILFLLLKSALINDQLSRKLSNIYRENWSEKKENRVDFATKGISEERGIFIDRSTHVECCCLLECSTKE